MRTDPVIIDTGPLVAYIDRSQAHHTWVKSLDVANAAPWLTCEVVIAEAWFLLRRTPWMQDVLVAMIARQAVAIPYALAEDIEAIMWLRRKYRDVPMSLADACLVRMAEAFDRAVVLTFDSDFAVYRASTGQAIDVLRPPGP
ncbi:MAG: PIN domain-containing protein [Rhodospirillaceae bacterium]|nr:PIN domain-containing protein [Rhodospirillaceae bacterium]